MRRLVIPALVAAAMWAAMLYQASTPSPVFAEPPEVSFGEVPGFASEAVEPSEAELQRLPGDTRFVKRAYRAEDGRWFVASAVIGGRHKSSIHRPELCIPSQGFLMTNPRTARVGGTDWRMITLARGGGAPLGFAYTFFNQDGYRTSSSMARIFRDVWDRSVHNRLDRWVMVTVNAWSADDRDLAAVLKMLEGVSPCLK